MTPPPTAPLGSATVLPLMPRPSLALKVTPPGSPGARGALSSLVSLGVGLPGTDGPVVTVQREPFSSSAKLGSRCGYRPPETVCDSIFEDFTCAEPGETGGRV